MGRHYANWLEGFLDYSSHGEAPTKMYFWTGVAALAGALRRKVWIDQRYFQWYPNFYIILVAPPGIVSKSTTADVGMSLLREVPDIAIGPSVVTWPALIQAFTRCTSSFTIDGAHMPNLMSALTIVSSEFGNLVNPDNREMIDTLVNLWDGKGFTKETKTSGNDTVVNPWLNIIACTTPEWIAGSFPEYMIGGGFTSRCLFVYADKKEQYVAYPAQHVPADHEAKRLKLIHDLEWVSQRIAGEYHLTSEALEWGEAWYRRHYEVDVKKFDPTRFGGYAARKQTHVHKLAIVLAAAESDRRVVQLSHLQLAYEMVTDLEPQMSLVFDRIGLGEEARQVLSLLAHLEAKGGSLEFKDAYKKLSSTFAFKRDMDEVMNGLEQSGQIRFVNRNGTMYIELPKQNDAPKVVPLHSIDPTGT